MAQYFLFDHGTRRFIELKDGMILGRAEGEARFPRDEALSRRHLQVNIRGDCVFITELKTTNGVKINGRQMRTGSRVQLQVQDSLTLGQQMLTLVDRFRLVPEETSGLRKLRDTFQASLSGKGKWARTLVRFAAVLVLVAAAGCYYGFKTGSPHVAKLRQLAASIAEGKRIKW